MDAQLRVHPQPLVLLLTSRSLLVGGLLLATAATPLPLNGQQPDRGKSTLVASAGNRLDLQTLRGSLDRLIDDPALERAHVGMVVLSAESGEVLFERAAGKRFVAASTSKLVTGAVALSRLGADHRWRTRLAAAGPVRDGVLSGDLWIVGGGDPTLTRHELDDWAERLLKAGIRRVTGDVIADDRVFDALPWGRGWMWDDLYGGWAAGVSGLQLSPGRVRAELIPAARVGDPAVLHYPRDELGLSIDNRVRTGAPGSEIRLRWLPSPEGDAVALEGWVPADLEQAPLSLAPDHPTLHLLRALADALQRAGVSVSGTYRRPLAGETAGQEHWQETLVSGPLADVLPRMLKPSDNQIAEVLLRTLGRELGEDGSAEAGLDVVGETLAGWGIEPGAADLSDGSGLSRYNELTPMALGRLLRRLHQLPEFDAFARALPVAGVDGTLAGRFVATAADGNVRAKTGSLAGVRALAGYVIDGDGETLVFALLINGFAAPGDVATALEDLLVEQLALFHGPHYPAARHRDP
jgi:D-alanyl-D-alanine carboxypeptidase/D-alanyl-D-alanine-endopeptidase (penicillin-binding protein 4)